VEDTLDVEAKQDSNRLAYFKLRHSNRAVSRTNTSAFVNDTTLPAMATSQKSITGNNIRDIANDSTTISRKVKFIEPSVTKVCILCTRQYEGEEVVDAQFPFACRTCDTTTFCMTCIKGWFMDACWNESRMPPKCCYAIPIKTVAACMDAGQVSNI